jgi:O-antigen/teichoic acid export membrane protein
MLLANYSDEIVTILFTAEYRPAVPVFAAFTSLMYLSCFDFHLPLRVRNANKFFLLGSLIKLVLNLALLYPTYLAFGLLGPVIALVISQLLFVSYLGLKVTDLFGVDWIELVPWRDVAKVLFAIFMCAPILLLGRYLVDQQLIRLSLFGVLYLAAYIVTLRLLGMSEVIEMIGRVRGVLARVTRNAKQLP